MLDGFIEEIRKSKTSTWRKLMASLHKMKHLVPEKVYEPEVKEATKCRPRKTSIKRDKSAHEYTDKKYPTPPKAPKQLARHSNDGPTFTRSQSMGISSSSQPPRHSTGRRSLSFTERRTPQIRYTQPYCASYTLNKNFEDFGYSDGFPAWVNEWLFGWMDPTTDRHCVFWVMAHVVYGNHYNNLQDI